MAISPKTFGIMPTEINIVTLFIGLTYISRRYNITLSGFHKSIVNKMVLFVFKIFYKI